jgi:hypothetical protein
MRLFREVKLKRKGRKMGSMLDQNFEEKNRNDKGSDLATAVTCVI